MSNKEFKTAGEILCDYVPMGSTENGRDCWAQEQVLGVAKEYASQFQSKPSENISVDVEQLRIDFRHKLEKWLVDDSEGNADDIFNMLLPHLTNTSGSDAVEVIKSLMNELEGCMECMIDRGITDIDTDGYKDYEKSMNKAKQFLKIA